MPASSKPGVADGVVEYEIDGVVHSCNFGASNIDEFVSSLHAGDEVEFDLVKNKFVEQCGARNLTLLLQAKQGIEIGQISVLKTNFGFIKCCSRIADMFFHVNALQEGSLPLEPGVDVQFIPVLDTNTNKLIASELKVLPPGSAVFESVSEREYNGLVRIVCQDPRGNIPGVSGIIVGVVEGVVETLPFSHTDLLSAAPTLNQKVMFRLVEDRQVSSMKKAGRGNRVNKHGGKKAGFVRICPEVTPPVVVVQRSEPRMIPVPSRPAASTSSPSYCEEAVLQAEASPAALASPMKLDRVKGKVVRLSKKRVSGKVACGYVRAVVSGSWHDRKPLRRTSDAPVGSPAVAPLDSRLSGLPEDVMFMISDLSPELRDTLRANDEVEYSVVPGENGADLAVNIVRLGAPKIINKSQPVGSLPREQPVPMVFTTTGERLKFTGGSGATNAKGPDGTRGFAAGRGRALPDLENGRNLSTSFKLSSAIMAANFVPKMHVDDDALKHAAANRQFEDASPPEIAQLPC